jgi:hypothetical protein
MNNEKNCESCKGDCCKYIAMEIDIPEEIEDFENLRWYLAHENISIFVEEDGIWNIEFKTPCKYLTKNHKCTIHESFIKNPKIKRPQICKEFTVEQCPHHNEYEELYRFNEVEDVDEYIEKIFNKGLHEVIEED